MAHDEELGYPHEIILNALNQSTTVVNGQYRKRTKLFANLLRKLLDEKLVESPIEEEHDQTIRLLWSLSYGSSKQIRNNISNFCRGINEIMEDVDSAQSETSYQRVKSLLKEGFFLHILCKEMKDHELFTDEDLQRFLNFLSSKDNELRSALSAMRLWGSGNSDVNPHTLVFEFGSFSDHALQEVALFLSYALGVQYPRIKRELLLAHYTLVRKVVTDFKNVTSQENLSDQLLESFFKTAAMLFCCGYSKSLRLPHEEKIRYAKEILALPSIENSFNEVFDEVTSVKIPKTHLRFPLWVLLGINAFLLVLHLLHEIYLPWQISQLGIQIALPSVPVFLTFAFFITIFTLVRLSGFKKKIGKKLRRGKIENNI